VSEIVVAQGSKHGTRLVDAVANGGEQ